MKIKKIATLVITTLAVGMVILSGIMKFVGPPELTEQMASIGLGAHLPVLGLMEISFALLFLWPKTLRIGFVLLACYFAGALAVELANGKPFNALLPMVLVWIAAWLRDQEVLWPAKQVA